MSPSDSKAPVRILIADDHVLLRAGLRSLLAEQPDMHVVGEAGDGNEALAQSRVLRPDLVLLDIAMPLRDGIDTTAALKQLFPNILVLILTAHEDAELLREALRAGAAGYVVKRAVGSELVGAIHAVLRGDLYVHPAVTRALFTDTARPAPREDPTELLTPREVEILRLLSLGYTNAQIAEELTLSVRTVQSHRANLIGKLGLRNRADLVRYAMEKGLMPKQ